MNNETKASATALAGQGLMGVARDTYGRDGTSKSYVAGFAEVEVDVETGHYRVLDLLAVADVGTVLHPRSLGGQILGGIMLGFGHAFAQKWVYDQHYGVPLAKRFYQTRPPTILDAPAHMASAALDIADPETPVGDARHRRVARRLGLRLRRERDHRRGGPRRLRAGADLRRHDPHGARRGRRDAPGAYCERLGIRD